MKPFRVAILIGLAPSLLVGAEGRRKLWELDLSVFVNHQKDLAGQVWGIHFSPDESKVAIGFGSHLSWDPRTRHVVIVARDQPRTVLREFELNVKGVPLPSGDVISWSPSGTTLVARTFPPVMLRLGKEAPCTFPEESQFGGFLSEDRLVIFLRGNRQDKAEIRILRSDCSLADSWETRTGPADVLDTSPEQDLVAIINFREPSASSVVELVAPGRHEVKQRWIWDTQFLTDGGFLFADHGKLVCSSYRPNGKREANLACWGTQTGARTAQNSKVGVWLGSIESTGGELLAITDYRIREMGRFWTFLDMSNTWIQPRRRLIWNFRTGEEVVSWGEFSMPWGGFQQKELVGKDLKDARTTVNKFVLALSSTGKYVAEGGSGSVSVYAVQP